MDDLLDRLNAALGIKEPKKERVPQDVDRVSSPRIASERRALEDGAKQLGIDPRDYATAISYETAGTFDPWKAGPVTKWGQHRGTIQYGEPQRKQFGVYEGQPFEEQVTKSNVKYLKNAGVKPGMTFDQIYTAINGGSVKQNRNTQDADTGRTIADNIRLAQRDHRAKALKRYGWNDDASPTPAVDDLMERLNKVTQGVTADEPSDPLLDRLNAVTATTQAENVPSPLGGSVPGKGYVLPENVGGTQLPPVNPTGVPLKTNATVMPSIAEQVVAEQPLLAEPPIAAQQQPSVLQDRPQPFVETPVQQIAPTQRRVVKGQPQPVQTSVQQAPQPRYETSEAVISDVPEERAGLPVQAVTRGDADNAVVDTIQIDPNLSPRDAARQGLTELARKYNVDVNKVLQEYSNLQATTTTGKIDVTVGDLKRMGVDTDALISQKMAESRVETPQPDLNLKGLPKFSQVDKTEDELRDQYRKEEIAKLDPSSVNRWISELIKNPFSRAMDAYDAATGQVTDIDKIVNERINALPQSGQGRRSVEQYNPENDAPFPIAKAASLGSNFYKGLVVDNFAPMLETAGYGQALFDNYILGKPTAVKDTSLFKSASAMRDTHEKGLAKMPDTFGEEQFTRTLGQAAGQMLMAAGGVATLNPTNVGRMTMIQGAMTEVAQVSAEAYRAAIARPGTTEDQARLAAMLVAPTGLVGGLSEAKLFSSLKHIQGLDLATNGKFSSQLMAKFKAVASSGNQVGISELIEEGIQGLGGEVGAQLAYRKNDRDLKGFLKDIDEMAKNAILAYPVGAILGGGTATAQMIGEGGVEADTPTPRQSRTDALLKTEVPQKTEPVIEPIKMGAERTAPNPLASSDGLKTVDGIPIVGTDVKPNTKVRVQPIDNSGNFAPIVKETKPELTPAEQTAAIKASRAEVAKAEAEIETARKTEIYETAKQALSLPFIEPKALPTKAEQAKAQKAMANKYEFTDADENGDEITDTYTGFQRQKELKKQSKKLDTLLKCLNG